MYSVIQLLSRQQLCVVEIKVIGARIPTKANQNKNDCITVNNWIETCGEYSLGKEIIRILNYEFLGGGGIVDIIWTCAIGNHKWPAYPMLKD